MQTIKIEMKQEKDGKRSLTVPEQFAFYNLILRLNLRRAARTAVEASKREEFQPQRTYLMCMPFSLLTLAVWLQSHYTSL